MQAAIALSHVSVGYGALIAAQDVSFDIEPGQIACLVGPSGSGKTSVLRAIAGFEPVRAGRIELLGRIVSDTKSHVPPEQRGVGVVFQDFALFPHLSVARNIAFGLQGLKPATREQRISTLLELVDLAPHADKFPHQLSGGQQQRVALARALAPNPPLLLIDEPFASLDAALRQRLGSELRRVLKSAGVAALLITHDQPEAFALADRIGVIAAGHLHQWGTALELFQRPATPFVAGFLGAGNLVPGVVSAPGEFDSSLGRFAAAVDYAVGTHFDLLLRPHDLCLARATEGYPADLIERVFRGPDWLYRVRLQDGLELTVADLEDVSLAHGEQIGIKPKNFKPIAFRSERFSD